MTEQLRQAAIMWGNPGTWIFTGSPPERADTDVDAFERYDTVVAGGKRTSYVVGERRFLERTFRWQSDALIDAWRAFWRAWGGLGREFWYYDASPPIYGSAGNFGAAGLFYGDSSPGILVVAEPTEFRPAREDTWGYWSWAMTMRRFVA